MASTYTLNVTAMDIINALKAGKSILIHITENDGTETFVSPTTTSFNTSEFTMSVPILAIGGYNYINFTSSNNLNSILTAEYQGSTLPQTPDIS